MTEAHSGAWWNERIEAAIERAAGPIEEALRRHVPKVEEEVVGFPRTTWEDLMEMDAVDAIERITRMIQIPATAADGLKFLRKIMEIKVQQEAMV